MFPHSTTRKGRPLRLRFAWITRAASVFPVPQGPWISTGPSPLHARAIPRKTGCMLGAAPISEPASFSAGPAMAMLLVTIVEITSSKRWRSRGLKRYSAMPSFCEAIVWSSVAWAVMTSTGTLEPDARIFPRTSSPLISGRPMSITMASKARSAIRSSAAAPLAARVGMWPRRRTASERALPRACSSSTIRMAAMRRLLSFRILRAR